MLPPIDPATASANPRFEALYNDLCKNKLNANGTSAIDAEFQKSRSAFESELQQARVYAARKDVVINALKELSYSADALPVELHELVIIAAVLLEGQITGEDLETVQDDLKVLEERLPDITVALSKHIEEHADHVTRVTAHGVSRADLSPQEVISTWKETATRSRQAILQSRIDQTVITRSIHDTYRQIIEVCIRILEQTVHGAVSRSTKAKADYLATVAEGMSKKLEVQYGQILAQIDSEDARTALKTRVQEVSKQNRQLKAQCRERQELLDEVRQAGSVAAKEYVEVLKDIRTTRSELEVLRAR